jgi:hypothetical protein
MHKFSLLCLCEEQFVILCKEKQEEIYVYVFYLATLSIGAIVQRWW